MIQVKRLGHAAFEADDVASLVDYYRNVVGFAVTGEEGDGTTFLTSSRDHQTVAVIPGSARRLDHVGFMLAADADLADAQASLRAAGIEATRKRDAEPGIPDLLEFSDPEGNTIQLYAEVAQDGPGYRGVGIQPQKLGHICLRADDVKRLSDFYESELGFRWSDWIGDFFVFLRCNSDHHALNLLKGPQGGNVLHHIAYELRDFADVQPALDHLYHHGYKLVWGPGRHGPGHNVFTYHEDAHGHKVELFTQLDVMLDESLGYFEPRPWHEDNPQRPKVWEPDPLAPNRWGITPPADFM